MTMLTLRVRASLVLAALVALVPLSAYAGSIPLNVKIYVKVWDEQDTNTFHGGTTFCPGTSPFFDQGATRLTGDSLAAATGASSLYNVSPWTTLVSETATSYEDNTFYGTNWLRAQFNSNNKILSLDTRGTSGPRKLSLSFGQSCNLPGCPTPSGSTTVFDGSVMEAMLVNVFLNMSFTAMEVCSSVACMEAEPAFAKIWFTLPSDPSTTWRVDWAFLRVLRVKPDTWYIIADGCDGTWIAGLSKLIGNRTRPKTVFNGYYLMPFFIEAVKK